jgi:hypothetical protein
LNADGSRIAFRIAASRHVRHFACQATLRDWGIPICAIDRRTRHWVYRSMFQKEKAGAKECADDPDRDQTNRS